MTGITWAAHRRGPPLPNPHWQRLAPAVQQEAVNEILSCVAPQLHCTSVEHGARVTVRAEPGVTGADLLALERELKALLDPTLYLEKTEQPDKNQLRLRGVEAL